MPSVTCGDRCGGGKRGGRRAGVPGRRVLPQCKHFAGQIFVRCNIVIDANVIIRPSCAAVRVQLRISAVECKIYVERRGGYGVPAGRKSQKVAT